MKTQEIDTKKLIYSFLKESIVPALINLYNEEEKKKYEIKFSGKNELLMLDHYIIGKVSLEIHDKDPKAENRTDTYIIGYRYGYHNFKYFIPKACCYTLEYILYNEGIDWDKEISVVKPTSPEWRRRV